MNVQIAIALIDLVVVIVLIARRVEVGLVLLAAAVPLFAVSGGLKQMLTTLVEEMANPGRWCPFARRWGSLMCYGSPNVISTWSDRCSALCSMSAGC